MLEWTHLLLAVFALSMAAGEVDDTSQNWRKPTVSNRHERNSGENVF